MSFLRAASKAQELSKKKRRRPKRVGVKKRLNFKPFEFFIFKSNENNSNFIVVLFQQFFQNFHHNLTSKKARFMTETPEHVYVLSYIY